jgi:glutamate/tyrosine decarboxylase-like PLP-dependent enzyme
MVWSILREQGAEGVRVRIKRDNDYARFVADFAKNHPKLELVTRPELSIVCFRYISAEIEDLNQFNRELLRKLLHQTPFAPSATTIDEKYVIRPCFINTRTTMEQVEQFVSKVVELGNSLLKESQASAAVTT